MTTIRRWVLGAVIAMGMLSTADARLCAPGMYCPQTKVTLRVFGAQMGGCNSGGTCGTFRVTSSFTMTGYGEERNCMHTEPCGNIVAIYPDGGMDWSVNGSWEGPVW
jgi:hypothetical protein